MRNSKLKEIAAMVCLLTTVSACGANTKVESLELVTPTTKQEVLDYYANALRYEAVITRSVEDNIKETSYEEYEITGDKAEELKAIQLEIEEQLSAMRYEETVNKDVISEDCFNYIKAYINDVSLAGGTVENVSGALGYYFVDVAYETSAGQIGTLKGTAPLVGVNGAYVENPINKEVALDEIFITSVVENANRYFLLNGINKNVTYSEGESFRINDGSADAGDYYSSEEVERIEGINQIEGYDTIENEDAEDNELSTEVESETTEEEVINDILENNESTIEDEAATTDTYEDITISDRRIGFDIYYLSKVAGSSAESSAMMPELDMVYNIPSNAGKIGGIGIYPCGNDGMRIFGYNRESSKGVMKLRYVFKDKEDGSGSIETVMVYPRSYANSINEIAADNTVLIPDYVMQELENTVERADRIIVNGDLTGAISDRVFNDLGFGILRGYYSKSTNILKCVTGIRQAVARDIENNAYLLEVETTIIEGPKSADCYGTYKDRSYIVIQQEGTEFKITDWVRISRTTVDEPDIDADNSSLKRLVALNLAGEVSDEAKQSAEELLKKLYKASTHRVLYGPKDITVGGETVTIEKGMYDCFNSDTMLLSSEKKETLNARLRSYLTAYGVDVSAEYVGRIDEWIGGADNQIEFTAEEIIVYGDYQAARYMRTYYLVSSINDVWVIDEMNILDTEEIDVREIESTYKRIVEE